MRISDRVTTKLGPGIIVKSEGERDSRAFRWCVKLDQPNQWQEEMQNRQGGLYMAPSEVTKEITS